MKTFFSACLVWIALLGFTAAPAAHAKIELGLQAWTFRELTLLETIDEAAALGIRHIQCFPGQKLAPDTADKFHHTMSAEALQRVLAHAKAKQVSLTAYGVVYPKDAADWETVIAFATRAGLREIATEVDADKLAPIAARAAAAKVRITLHNHPAPSIYADPAAALAALDKLGQPRVFGLCADTGHWARSGFDPVATLRRVEGRVVSLHLKDIAERGRKSRDVPYGTGTSDLALQLAELRRQSFDGVAYIEYEHQSPRLREDIAACVEFFRAAMKLSDQQLARGLVAPAGFVTDVRATYAEGRGADSARWPTPQPLFAADLSNAEMQPGAWAFNAEGVLAPTRAPGERARGDLWTRESYGDFVLALEFRTQDKSNSGVFLRCSDTVNWLHTAIEVQILQGQAPMPSHAVGAIFDVAPPSRIVPITPGEWYRYVIIAQGSKITVILNGEEVNKIDLNKWTEAGKNPDGTPNKFKYAYKDMARSGRIGLQDHGQQIEFRNLTIERL